MKQLTMFLILALSMPIATSSIYGMVDEDDKKDLCKENGGDWNDGSCDTNGDDEKADKFLSDVDRQWEFNEEKAELEDELCDSPEDSDKFDVCKS